MSTISRSCRSIGRVTHYPRHLLPRYMALENLLELGLSAVLVAACAPQLRSKPSTTVAPASCEATTTNTSVSKCVTATWPVANGAEVRLVAPALGQNRRSGVATSATKDTLFFREEPQTITRPIGVGDITQLEVVQGSHTHRMRDARFGFVIGAIVGGVAGVALTKTHPPCQSNTVCLNPDGLDRTYNALLGGTVAGLLGALIGAGSGGTEANWVPVALPRNR